MRERTQPSVIKFLSSVNCMTSSSSSIVHVSLVECCFGIRRVVTTNFVPLSFPSRSPHVSMFMFVFAFASVRNRGRHSRGILTVRRTGDGSAGFAERVMRSESDREWVGAEVGSGGAVAGTGGAGREGPGYEGYWFG
jgi:hypothetical protein